MTLRKAFTIVEMIVVLCVIAALASLSLPLFSGTMSSAASATTLSTLNEVANATRLYWSDSKHVKLDGVTTVAAEATRFQIRWLFRNPIDDTSNSMFDINSAIGWRGPYLLSSTGSTVHFGDVTIIDAWNQPIVLQDLSAASNPRDIRVVSGGPNGAIQIPLNVATSNLNASDIGDDLYVALQLH